MEEEKNEYKEVLKKYYEKKKNTEKETIVREMKALDRIIANSKLDDDREDEER